ncbi:BREX-3 system P-loop-containing protein BrxF [Bacillus massilinigeriensis]|uniref:BREX-3 system P-loop-containing protein BrxF n=1 Tax=Bacillus massilionigeriensis TaxID=1805475 RepID=UPI00096AEB97|nr:BREX-3 system P-loop-containing protein BrxF [Bacillus massilionigeriensis]
MSLQQIKSEIETLDSRWYKLLIICGLKPYQDKDMANQLDIPFININLKLSEKLKDISKAKYALKVPEILQSILEQYEESYYWLGDIEILFDKQLQQNPVRLLENLGKRYSIIVTWPGQYANGQLTYATPEHPEFFSCHETDGKILEL